MKAKKLIALLSAAAMAVSVMPASVYAEETDTAPAAAVSTDKTEDLEVFGDTLTFNNYEYYLDENGNAVITGYTGSLRHLIIPEKIITHTVVAIDKNAFAGNKNIERVVIPSTVERIGYSAFLDCSSIKYLDLGKGVKVIDGHAFEECHSIEELIIPDNVTALSGSYTFSGCGAYSAIFGKNLEETGDSTMQWCGNLTDVILKEGVKFVTRQTFNRAGNIKRIFMPKSLTGTGLYAFANNGDSPCMDIFYAGSKEDWEKVGRYETPSCHFGYCTVYFDCPQPSYITSLGNSNDGPVLTWTASPEAGAYRIYRTEDLKGELQHIGSVRTRTFTDTTAVAGKTYYYHVVAVKDSDSFSYSTPKKITVAPPPVSAPKATVTAGTNSAVIRWSGVSDATSYRVFYRLNGTSKWAYKNTTKTAMNLTGLTGGKKYDILVRAYNANTKTWSKYTSANILTVTPKKAVAKPVVTSVTAGANKAVIRWNAVSGVKYYRVYYRVKGTAAWSCKNTALTAMNLTGLTGGKTYEIAVRATDGTNWSAFTTADIKTVTPKKA